MQAQLAEIASRKRAEEDGPVDHDRDADFVALRNADFKPTGEMESLKGVADELEQWNEDEDHWRDFGDDASCDSGDASGDDLAPGDEA